MDGHSARGSSQVEDSIPKYPTEGYQLLLLHLQMVKISDMSDIIPCAAMCSKKNSPKQAKLFRDLEEVCVSSESSEQVVMYIFGLS